MRRGAPPEPAAIRHLLTAAASVARTQLAPRSLKGLEDYLQTLLRWRDRISLVSQRNIGEIIAKHIQDSLAVVPIVPEGARVADLGSGAGFPGMVIAIARPDVIVHLVESQRRKASFLREAVRETGLANASVVEGRAELIAGSADWTGAYDLVVSRAVWTTSTLLALALPLLRHGGLAVAMKTPGDVVPATASGYASLSEHRYVLSGGEERVLILGRVAE